MAGGPTAPTPTPTPTPAPAPAPAPSTTSHSGDTFFSGVPSSEPVAVLSIGSTRGEPAPGPVVSQRGARPVAPATLTTQGVAASSEPPGLGPVLAPPAVPALPLGRVGTPPLGSAVDPREGPSPRRPLSSRERRLARTSSSDSLGPASATDAVVVHDPSNACICLSSCGLGFGAVGLWGHLGFRAVGCMGVSMHALGVCFLWFVPYGPWVVNPATCVFCAVAIGVHCRHLVCAACCAANVWGPLKAWC